MSALLAACGGFLLAVLWMDLMFDVLALRTPRATPIREPDLATIAGYYRRVTTEAQPMSVLIAIVMLALVLGSVRQLVWGEAALGWRVLALLLCALPIVHAQRRIFPSAVRLGGRDDPAPTQDALAREIARAHVACFVAIAGFVAIQIVRG
jgi:hypothetical protein